jgi:ER lumen protein retaining receptor
MKLVFLGTSCAIVYYIRYHRIIRLTYDKDQDTFRHWMLIAPSAALALISAHPRTLMEVRTCSSTALKQDSIQPQLIAQPAAALSAPVA